MVDQTTLNGEGTSRDKPVQAAARHAGELLHDVLSLAELQGRLLVVDIHQDVRRLIPLGAVLVAGVGLALSCLPFALVCVGLLLLETTRLSPAQAFGITLLGGMIVALILLTVAAWLLRYRLQNLLRRSRTEWHQNFGWVKQTLRRAGSRSAHPRP